MALEKIYQNSTSTGTHTSNLGFVRKLNSNSETLGTTTKLNLKDKNTPELIKKAFREQANNKINYATPGGPEYTMNRVVDGVVQIYNKEIETKEYNSIKDGDVISVQYNENPTNLTAVLLKSLKDESYEMFPIVVGNSNAVSSSNLDSGFGFQNNFICIGNPNAPYVYIDDNMLELLQTINITMTGYTETGWYTVGNKTESSIELQSKVEDFNTIASQEFTIRQIVYSNLNDEHTYAQEVMKEEFIDLIKTIEIARAPELTKLSKNDTIKVLINEHPTEFADYLLTEGIKFPTIKDDSEHISIGLISPGAPGLSIHEAGEIVQYVYINDDIKEVLSDANVSVTNYSEVGWYKIEIVDTESLSFGITEMLSSLDFYSKVMTQLFTITDITKDSIPRTLSSAEQVNEINLSEFKDLFFEAELMTLENTNTINTHDTVQLVLNETPTNFVEAVKNKAELPNIYGDHNYIGNKPGLGCCIELSSASKYYTGVSNASYDYYVYINDDIKDMLPAKVDNITLNTSGYNTAGWYHLVKSRTSYIVEQVMDFDSIKTYILAIDVISTTTIEETSSETEVDTINVSENFKDLFTSVKLFK